MDSYLKLETYEELTEKLSSVLKTKINPDVLSHIEKERPKSLAITPYFTLP